MTEKIFSGEYRCFYPRTWKITVAWVLILLNNRRENKHIRVRFGGGGGYYVRPQISDLCSIDATIALSLFWITQRKQMFGDNSVTAAHTTDGNTVFLHEHAGSLRRLLIVTGTRKQCRNFLLFVSSVLQLVWVKWVYK